MVVALDHPFLIVRHHLDDMLRADRHTFLAALTGFAVDQCDLIYDMNSVKRTDFHAGTIAQAAEIAGLRAVVLDIFHHPAVANTIVAEALVGLIAGARAFDKSYHFGAGIRFHSHDGSDAGCHRCSSDRTSSDWCLTLGDRSCQARTSGITASAAVIARQRIQNCRFLFIYFNGKLLSGKSEE